MIPALVVIPCGARKRATISQAKDLYTGPYFTACLRAAMALSPCAVRILSAKHGLILPTDVIEPYDLRMGAPGCATAELVRMQAQTQGLDGLDVDDDSVVILAGRDYADVAKQVWPRALEPLAGVGGMGKQMRRLAQIAATRRL